MQKDANCPVCSTWAVVQEFTERTKVACDRCGRFAITSTALKIFGPPSEIARLMISGWIREHQDIYIHVEDLPKLYDLQMPSVGEKAEKILLWLERKCPFPGTVFVFQNKHN